MSHIRSQILDPSETGAPSRVRAFPVFAHRRYCQCRCDKHDDWPAVDAASKPATRSPTSDTRWLTRRQPTIKSAAKPWPHRVKIHLCARREYGVIEYGGLPVSV